MNAHDELPEVDEHALDELLEECKATLHRLALGAGAALVLALVLGTLYLQAMAARAA